MRARTLCLVTAAAVVLAGGVVRAQDAGPSIDEMFEAVGGAGGTSDAAPGAGGAPARPHGKPPKPPRPQKKPPTPRDRKKGPTGVEADIKAARSRAMLRANYYNRQSKPWHLAMTWVNLGEHKKAHQVFATMLHKRTYNATKSPVRDALRIAPDPLGHFASDSSMEKYGVVQLAYAWSLMNLGQDRLVRQLLAEGSQKLATYRWSVPRSIKNRKLLVQMGTEVFEQAKARLEELEASLAEAPDGDKQWEVAVLCQPEPGKKDSESRWRLDIPLKRLEALLTMVEKYPEHRHVMSGDVHWNLCQAWRAFEMHEKSVAVLDEAMGKGFKSYNFSSGNALWEKAEAYARLGVLREEMGARDAAGAYRLSLETFRAFKEKYPKSSRCKIGRSGYSTVQGRVRTLEAALAKIMR